MFDPPRDHTKSNPEDDSTAVGEYEWSGVELDADEVFSEFPSENGENIVPAISHDPQASKRREDARAATRQRWERLRRVWQPLFTSLLSRTRELISRLWNVVCGLSRRQSDHITVRGRSALLVSSCSFAVGVVAGAAIVWLSGRPVPERPDVQVAHVVTPALPLAEASPTPANQSTPQVPARSVVPSARRPAFRGSLIVYSRPPGARVLLNGRRAGMTPLVLENQNVGSRAVRLELDGYEAWTSAVRVVTNTSTRVRADLKPARALLEPPESQSASTIGTPSR